MRRRRRRRAPGDHPGAAGGRRRRSPAIERAAAHAFLRAHGAILLGDPDAWLEAICLAARGTLPAGPRTAVVASPGSWLEASARAQAGDGDGSGRGVALAAVAADLEPADVVLIDRAGLGEVPASRAARALVVPVVARGELADDDAGDALVGLRAALGAVAACGRAVERIAAGLGPAPREARAELEIDEPRIQRQLDKLLAGDRRIGDHEAKVLLAAYGVPVTRQAVATTPSAATRVAKKAGYPVEIRPWGSDAPSERAGCPVERGISTAAEVRRAFLAVLGAAGLPSAEADGAAVIVRETPPAGRELCATIAQLGPLGWTVWIEVAGAPAPVAAPAPLRLVDAAMLAAAVTATRAGEPEPDRVALANLLRRATHLAVDQGFERVELGRVIAAPKGARSLVVDAEIIR
ncbi:MAG: acetate--CoA ligase family protein [Kofleriaceae bacterium]|nr:acetate--CoA ligase family protein [Kofleriaceae bacterium]